MNSPNHGFLRVSAESPCPICGKPDWCLFAEDGSAAICPRTSEGATRYLDDAGYLHILRRRRCSHVSRRVIIAPAPSPDMTDLAQEYESTVDPFRVEKFAAELGLSYMSLFRLQVGWSSNHRAWTFPMRDEKCQVVGIRLRTSAGQKFAVAGGHQGLHVPRDLGSPNTILITEGPTDAAAMLDLGLAAIGRPSCTGGEDYLIQLARPWQPELVVVGDNDDAGRRGAAATASSLVLYFPSVKIIYPPAGVKDARAWKLAGACRADVQAAIAAAPICRLHLT